MPFKDLVSQDLASQDVRHDPARRARGHAGNAGSITGPGRIDHRELHPIRRSHVGKRESSHHIKDVFRPDTTSGTAMCFPNDAGRRG